MGVPNAGENLKSASCRRQVLIAACTRGTVGVEVIGLADLSQATAAEIRQIVAAMQSDDGCGVLVESLHVLAWVIG